MTIEQLTPPAVVLSTAQLDRFEAWWGQRPVELVPFEPRSAEETLSAWVWMAWQAATLAATAKPEAPACNRGNLCPWGEESAATNWRSVCRKCGAISAGSGQ
jgi:hypothetical protein